MFPTPIMINISQIAAVWGMDWYLHKAPNQARTVFNVMDTNQHAGGQIVQNPLGMLISLLEEQQVYITGHTVTPLVVPI